MSAGKKKRDMKRPPNLWALYLIVFLEGYIILSSEVIAIRLNAPFSGTSTDVVCVIISAVLLPLALGYYAGGQFKAGYRNNKFYSVRKKLVRNLVVSGCFLLPAMSYCVLVFFFISLREGIWDNKLFLVGTYSALFLVVPFYLLGQTIPLISNYFPNKKIPEITGRMLFLSTMGSFLGAVFSTLVLMDQIGLHYTVLVNFILLSALVLLFAHIRLMPYVLIMLGVTALAGFLNSGYMMDRFYIVKNNRYNTMQAYIKSNGDRHLYINNNNSSMYNDARRKHPYAELAERIAVHNSYGMEPKDILVIGAGAFTFGYEDMLNHYVYVDLDKDLKDVAEEHILKGKIGENKKFYPLAARSFLNGTDQKFDLVLLDAYLGALTIPEALVTQEFFMQIKGVLKDKGVLLANFIVSGNFNNRFSRNIDNTLRTVFPHLSRHALHDGYHVWDEKPDTLVNALYIYKHYENYDAGVIYSETED